MNKLLNFGLIAPLAAASAIAVGVMPAQVQAADFVSNSGAATFNGVVNFYSGTPGTGNPAEFWFAQESTCVGAGTGCDFSLATATGLFNEAILPGTVGANSLRGGYQYLLPTTADLTSNTPLAAVLPYLALDSNAFLPTLGLAANNAPINMVSTGNAAPAGLDQFLQYTLTSTVAGGLPFLRFDANTTPVNAPTGPGYVYAPSLIPPAGGKPVIDIFLVGVDKFNSSFDTEGETGDTNVFGTIRATATFSDGTVRPLFGGGLASASFSFSDTQSALNIGVNLEKPQEVPEPTSIFGLAIAAGAGALSFRKKKETK